MNIKNNILYFFLPFAIIIFLNFLFYSLNPYFSFAYYFEKKLFLLSLFFEVMIAFTWLVLSPWLISKLCNSKITEKEMDKKLMIILSIVLGILFTWMNYLLFKKMENFSQ